ncbi:unnamed protein product [Haemonchus placei]|uniref:Uncharacterized protein n=1 Tax=Haemonchus placei TaxID=6290 RepID=A0A0N4WXY4_HAEPC|nr:unnamed protein product [Haemonchus placei]
MMVKLRQISAGYGGLQVIHTAPDGTVFIAFWLMFLILSCVAGIVFAGFALSAAAVRSRLLATTFEIVEYELLDNHALLQFSCPSDPEWKDIGQVGQKRSPQKVKSKGSRRFARFAAKTEGGQDPNETSPEDREIIPKSPNSSRETKSFKPEKTEEPTQLDSKEEEEDTNLKSENKTGRTLKTEEYGCRFFKILNAKFNEGSSNSSSLSPKKAFHLILAFNTGAMITVVVAKEVFLDLIVKVFSPIYPLEVKIRIKAVQSYIEQVRHRVSVEGLERNPQFASFIRRMVEQLKPHGSSSFMVIMAQEGSYPWIENFMCSISQFDLHPHISIVTVDRYTTISINAKYPMLSVFELNFDELFVGLLKSILNVL